MPTVSLEIDKSLHSRIEKAYELAIKNAPSDLGITTYWKEHLANIKIQGSGGSVKLSGESGFYFPGATYSSYDKYNAIKKKPFIDASNIKLSLPAGIGYEMDGRRISFDYVRAQFHIESIAKAFPSLSKCRTLLEIGSGTGIQAFAFSQFLPGITYIMVDLPGTLAFASYFLAKASPQSKFLYYHEWLESGLTNADFVFLPFYEISKLPDGICDLALNTDSMQEMNYETIGKYFQQLRRLLRGPRLFYQSNRKSKMMDGEDIQVDKFPYKKEDNPLFKRENPFMAEHWVKRKKFGLIPYAAKTYRTHIQSLTELSA
ncbi:MAG: hypothetical protein JWO30_957 [Fibrobacteres bacterium]|nr:hypothetical protein [Fibrobacterota bacterium]